MVRVRYTQDGCTDVASATVRGVHALRERVYGETRGGFTDPEEHPRCGSDEAEQNLALLLAVGGTPLAPAPTHHQLHGPAKRRKSRAIVILLLQIEVLSDRVDREVSPHLVLGTDSAKPAYPARVLPLLREELRYQRLEWD